ncbi:Polygalacturonase [Bienertia sinuspersici]
MNEEGVQNVTVKTAVISYSLSGVRIKSWGRPSNGFVKGIVFEDILMRNVFYPIVIDQNYCPHNINCPGQESGLQISDVKFNHIRGTSLRELAIQINCSATNPCTGIKLEKINFRFRNHEAKSFCKNAIGDVLGLGQLKSCLK